MRVLMPRSGGATSRTNSRNSSSSCLNSKVAFVAILLLTNILLLNTGNIARLYHPQLFKAVELGEGCPVCDEWKDTICPACPQPLACPSLTNRRLEEWPAKGKATNHLQQRKPPHFILHRIAGNDLPPLQSPGQLFYNIKYILDHESDFPDCEKRWVINYMANATERGLLLDLFYEHGYRQEQIVINRINRTALVGLNEYNWPKYEMGIIALNEGRNTALRDGFNAGARWVLPLDASQFITDESWKAFRATANGAEKRGQMYIKIPMFRLREEQQPWFLNASTKYGTVLRHAPLKGESQLIFRNDSKRWFDEAVVFGYRDKLEVLYEVCGKRKPTGNCGCGDAYPDILEGMPGFKKIVPRYPKIMKRCGYGVRLWQFPCEEPSLEETVKSVYLRPLVRIEGRQVGPGLGPTLYLHGLVSFSSHCKNGSASAMTDGIFLDWFCLTVTARGCAPSPLPLGFSLLMSSSSGEWEGLSPSFSKSLEAYSWMVGVPDWPTQSMGARANFWSIEGRREEGWNSIRGMRVHNRLDTKLFALCRHLLRAGLQI